MVHLSPHDAEQPPNSEQHPFFITPHNCQVPNLSEKWEIIFGRRTNGFFVEVGAYDGDNYSNTSCLADIGWAGIYIEPIKEFADRCRLRHARNKNISVIELAASSEPGLAKIFVGDVLTTLVGEQVTDFAPLDWAKGTHTGDSRMVETDTLDSVLAKSKVPDGFDLLVVDVEGSEEKVIQGFDINRWRPTAILIELEDEHPDFRNNPRIVRGCSAIRNRLAASGYSLYFKDHINSLYVRSDVFAKLDRNRVERDTLKSERDVLSADRDALKTERDTLRAERDALRKVINTWERRLRWPLWISRRVRESALRRIP